MKCIGFNLLTQEIKLRGKNEEEGREDRRGEWKTVYLQDIQRSNRSIQHNT